ncbi:MAG: hypothetical protein ABH883_07450 [Candidatus Omnitrophota bacterium]
MRKDHMRIFLMGLFAVSILFSTCSAISQPAMETVESLCGQAQGYLRNYMDTGKVDDRWAYLALEIALKARRLDESSALPHLTMAQVFIEMGELDKASERIKQAARLDPGNDDVAKLARVLRAHSAAHTGGLMTGIDNIEAIEYPDGASYVGGVRKGKRTGYGIYAENGGASYIGVWKDDKKDGHGTYSWSDGQKYTGEWSNDVRTGHGEYFWPDGHEYTGQFLDNKKHGHGVLKWPDGTVYTGEFRNDSINGHGKKYLTNKETYVGEFRDGVFYGHGIYNWPATGHKYIGMWNNTRAMGGYYFWHDGTKTWSYQDENMQWVNKKI